MSHVTFLNRFESVCIRSFGPIEWPEKVLCDYFSGHSIGPKLRIQTDSKRFRNVIFAGPMVTDP